MFETNYNKFLILMIISAAFSQNFVTVSLSKIDKSRKFSKKTVIPMNLPQTKTVSLNREIKESGI